jgi:hypothetical protein
MSESRQYLLRDVWNVALGVIEEMRANAVRKTHVPLPRYGTVRKSTVIKTFCRN